MRRRKETITLVRRVLAVSYESVFQRGMEMAQSDGMARDVGPWSRSLNAMAFDQQPISTR